MAEDLRKLVDEAEQLQTFLNVFCSHATAQRVTLPKSLHEAAAALLMLPDQLREAAERSEGHEAFRAGVRKAAGEIADGGGYSTFRQALPHLKPGEVLDAARACGLPVPPSDG
jgi:hypothetical protein